MNFYVIYILNFKMGNYSYFIYAFNCKHTKINIGKLKEAVKEIDDIKIYGSDDYWDYAMINEEEKEITCLSLEEYADMKHNTKFIQYLTPRSIKTLMLISLYTEFTDEAENKENPRIYYEYEGWDELYYIEFELGTENVYYGYKAFNFDDEFMFSIIKTKMEDDLKRKKEDAKKNFIRYLQFRKEINEEQIYDAVSESRDSYILGLVLDKFTEWKRRKLEPKENRQMDNKLSMLFMLKGLRIADLENDKEKIRKVLGL